MQDYTTLMELLNDGPGADAFPSIIDALEAAADVYADCGGESPETVLTNAVEYARTLA